MTVRATDRWRGIVALTCLAAAVGILSKSPGLLIVAGLGVGYAVYPRLVPTPGDSVDIIRSIDPVAARPGDRVIVELTVTNTGSSWIPDIRIIDGVPGPLEVVDGRPRSATALGPGQSHQLQYEVVAVEGRHRFDQATVLTRDIAGARERELHPSDQTILTCASRTPNVTLSSTDTGLPGQIPIDAGGSGIEFYQTRSYQPGDPVARIDWRQFARTGKLTTIESRVERQSIVIICVDFQESPDLSRITSAVDQIATAVVDAGHRVGMISVDGVTMWVGPGQGQNHLRTIRRTLDEHDIDDPSRAMRQPDSTPERGIEAGRRVARRCGSPGVQIALVSSLIAPSTGPFARYLHRSGVPVSVISPASADQRTLGGRLAMIDRSNRIDGLRRNGIQVVDWGVEDHLWEAYSRQGNQP